MKIKYVRVSSLDQNPARQKTNSENFDKVFEEKISGAIAFEKRPVGKKIYDLVKNGKIKEIHIQSIDRIGRNIIGILTIFEFLTTHKVNIFVENIGMYSMVNNKPNESFKMIVSVLGNVAEMERNSMLERQKEGIKVAKALGKYNGRLLGTKMETKVFLKKYANVVTELNNGESLRRTARLSNCSLGTVQRVKKALLETPN